MPNLINNQGNNTDVAANYRKSFAPFTLFGTRQLRFYNIYINNLNVGHADNGGDNYSSNAYESEFGGPDGWDAPDDQQRQPNYGVDSVFARIVSAVQTQAEIYGVFKPDYDGLNNPDSDSYFTVMVAGDTHADRQHADLSNNSMTLEDTIYEALQGTSCSSVSVYEAYIQGDYMDRDTGTSIARGTNKVSLSPEAQAIADALKAARAAARPAKPTK